MKRQTHRTSSIILSALLFMALTVTQSFAGSPLPGIVDYTQTLTLECATAQDAKNITLKTQPLPHHAKLAFSARWDDSNLKHLQTHKVMSKNGIKGTFYLNGWNNPKYGAEFCAKLLKDGNSLGAHTRSHPFLPSINADEMFYEIMSVRVKIENDSNTVASTMVLPYCQYGHSADKQIQKDVGKSTMNSGFIGAPEPYYGRYESTISYPKGTLAESALIRPGDRNVSEKKYNDYIKKYLGLGDKFARNPSMSVGIHSWHTAEGMKTLDKLLAESAKNTDWWFCNQNEYSAYRFEANNARISKKVDGKKVTFTITRYTPESLGENMDLWFTVSGTKDTPKIIAPQNAKIEKDTLILPQSSEQKMPEVIAVTSENATSKKLPDIKCELSVSDLVTPKVTLENNSKQTLEDVIITLRSGAAFTPGVIVTKAEKIDAGAKYQNNWKLEKKDSLRYNIGKPYYVIQFDFTKGGKRYRLYSTYRAPEPKIKNANVSANVVAFVDPKKDADLQGISKTGSKLSAIKLPKVQISDPTGLSMNAISFKVDKKYAKEIKGEPTVIFVFDFEPEKAGKMLLRTKANAMYLNGKKVEKNAKKRWELPVVAGKNRLVFSTSTKRVGYRDIRYIFPQDIKIKKYITAKK